MSIFMQTTTLLCKDMDSEEFQAGVVLSINPPTTLITHHTALAVLIVVVITVKKLNTVKYMFTLISIRSVTTLQITSEKEKSWVEIGQKMESDFNNRLDFKRKKRVSLIIQEPPYVDLIQINVNHQWQGHKTPTATLTQQNMEHNTQYYLKITTALLSPLLATLQAF